MRYYLPNINYLHSQPWITIWHLKFKWSLEFIIIFFCKQYFLTTRAVFTNTLLNDKKIIARDNLYMFFVFNGFYSYKLGFYTLLKDKKILLAITYICLFVFNGFYF